MPDKSVSAWTRRSFLAAPGMLAAAQAAMEPELIVRTQTFTEGPVFDYEGYLYFSHGDLVSRVRPGGDPQVWAEAQGANGHKVLPDGTHLLCAAGEHAVLRLDAASRRMSAASDQCDGEPLRAPNDITLDAHGGFYFSDPGGSREAPIGTIHYLDSNGKTHLAAGGMRVPNGLVLSPGQRTLYVSETVPNRVLAFDVGSPGQLGSRGVFAELPSKPDVQAEPDGMAVDSRGNLYVAHLGVSSVQVLDPRGNLIQTLPGGNYDVSNLAFGGAALDELYITGSTGHRSNTPGRVYRLRLEGVRGVPSLRPRA